MLVCTIMVSYLIINQEISGFEDDKCSVVIPYKGVKILDISALKDLKSLHFTGDNILDFSTIFPEYDTLHIKPTVLNHRALRDYSCETILWNNWKFKDIEPLDEYNK